MPAPAHSAKERLPGLAIVVALVLLALAPGVAARLGYWTAPGEPLAHLAATLEQISFGRGVRFWLGVTGAGLMALLLVYPVRKAFRLTGLVSIAAWFNLHIVVGLTAPILVLYHCNFGPGSKPANVALATTLLVAVSGLLGHYVYTRSSRRYFAARDRARASLDGAIALLATLDPGPSRDRLIEDLRAADTVMLGDQRSALATLRRAAAIRPLERDLTARTQWLIATHVSPVAAPLRAQTQAHLADYFGALRNAKRRSLAERAWAKWRLLHLPIFLVTILATGIHVVKVWGMDEPGTGAELAASEVSQPKPPASGSVTRIAVRPVPMQPMSAPSRRAPTQEPATAQAEITQESATTIHVATGRETPLGEARSTAPAVVEPEPAPQSATIEARPARPQPAPAPARPVAPAPKKAEPPPSRLTGVVAERAATQARTEEAGQAAVAELQRRSERDNTGKFSPAGLAERLKELKLEKFDHGKTRFPLTGKHATTKCESCHKTTLKDTAKECVACHKKDDVHRGRRPDCAQCHVTTDWTRIVKRK